MWVCSTGGTRKRNARNSPHTVFMGCLSFASSTPNVHVRNAAEHKRILQEHGFWAVHLVWIKCTYSLIQHQQSKTCVRQEKVFSVSYWACLLELPKAFIKNTTRWFTYEDYSDVSTECLKWWLFASKFIAFVDTTSFPANNFHQMIGSSSNSIGDLVHQCWCKT